MELFAMKTPRMFDDESKILYKRELSNYSNLSHPFIPKFYSKNDNNGSLIIEFINGRTLQYIKNFHFNDNEKITIIFELMIALEYLHRNKKIYRDLKPDNVIIDENQTAIIIDFDRMINFEDQNRTIDSSICFAAPEIQNEILTSACDVYSLGKMIYYIFEEEYPTVKSFSTDKLSNYIEIEKIYKMCIIDDPEKRQPMYKLILDFFITYHSQIQIDNFFMKFERFFIDVYDDNILYTMKNININDPYICFRLGIIYLDNKFITNDLKKSIYYFILSAKQNPFALLYIGIIYYFCRYINKGDLFQLVLYYVSSLYLFLRYKFVTMFIKNYNICLSNHLYSLGIYFLQTNFNDYDINKAIYYLSLSSDNNNRDAQNLLGIIYESEKYIPPNINKALHYYYLAANHDHAHSQFKLGCYYLYGEYVKQDIDKSIHYLTLSANQNHELAQKLLGEIYLGINERRDIKKSIHYLTQSSNQNNTDAQLILSSIYLTGIYTKKNIEKGIKYLTLSAEGNNTKAQFGLGMLYYKGQYVEQNIDKSIYYLTLSANDGFIDAFILLSFLLFRENDFKKITPFIKKIESQNHPMVNLLISCYYYEYKHDISKCIHYLTLSANQNDVDAQYCLGDIYIYDMKNNSKGIYYYELAAKQNHPYAQHNLGVIYHNGEHVKRDIDKSIYYFSNSAKQNLHESQFSLGYIYYNGKYINRDIKKSLYYLNLAADRNTEAQFMLGEIYFEGIYVKQNVKKAIQYLTLAADKNNKNALRYLIQYYLYIGNFKKMFHLCEISAMQNDPNVQLFLGMCYYNGYLIKQNINRGLCLINKSSDNGNIYATFQLGFFFQEGKNVEKDIEKAIKYYKQASSLNIQHAKNNLGIIYKYGCDSKIDKCLAFSVIYFKEAISQKNDKLALYNLAHIYIYQESYKNKLDESISLLIKSSNLGFNPSLILLCIILLKKYIKVENIRKELKNLNESTKLITKILQLIKNLNLDDKTILDEYFYHFQTNDFVYNDLRSPISTANMEQREKIQKDISVDFYEGFGIDLYDIPHQYLYDDKPLYLG